MVLIYRVRSFLAEWKSSEQRASITWTNCHFGGRRPFRPHERKILRAASGSAVPRRRTRSRAEIVVAWLTRHMPMPYRATLPVRSKRGAVHSASRFCLPIATPRAPAPFRAVCLWPKNSVSRQRRLGFEELGSNACFSDPEDEHFRSVLEGGNLPVILGPWGGVGIAPKTRFGPPSGLIRGSVMVGQRVGAVCLS